MSAPRFRRTASTLVGCALAAAALVATPTAGSAQGMGADATHLLRFGVGGGVIVPTSDARQALKAGVHAQAFMLVNALAGLPLRFNLGYQRFSLKDALTGGQGGTTTPATGNSQILAGVGGVQLDLLHGPVRPYITAGVGGFNVRNSVDTGAGETSSSDFKFGIDGGAGLALKLGRLSAFVEGRVQNVYTDQGAISPKSIQAVPVSFGLVF